MQETLVRFTNFIGRHYMIWRNLHQWHEYTWSLETPRTILGQSRWRSNIVVYGRLCIERYCSRTKIFAAPFWHDIVSLCYWKCLGLLISTKMSFIAFRYTNFDEPAYVFLSTHHTTMIETLRKGIPATQNTFREVDGVFHTDELKIYTKLADRLDSKSWHLILSVPLSNQEQNKLVELLARVSPKEFNNFVLNIRKMNL